MASNSDPAAALTVFLLVGLWTFFKGFRVFREYKVVADTPRIPIRSVPMGWVHIRGKAASDQLVPSPVTHTPCCFYKIQIDQWKSEGRSANWARLRTDLDGTKFYLEDDTGKILIDGYAAEYELPQSAERVVSSEHAGPGTVAGAAAVSDADLLQYVNYSGVHHMANAMEHWLDKRGPQDDPKREQVRQTALEMMQAIPTIAHGGAPPLDLIEKMMAVRLPNVDPAKEQQRQVMMQHVLELAKSGQMPLPSRPMSAASGRYRLREYLILPGQEYNISGSCAENPKAQDGLNRNVICQGTSEKTFLISSKSEQDTQKGLRNRAVLMIMGGAAVALVCLALLLNYLKLF